MGLRMWLLEAETKEKNVFRSQAGPEVNLNELTIAPIADIQDVVAGELHPKSDNAVERVLNMFDGEVVGFIGALKELYEERAAIMQFDGGLSRDQAESLAIKITLNLLET